MKQIWRLSTACGPQSGWGLTVPGAQGGEPAQGWLVIHGGPGTGAWPGLLDPLTQTAQTRAWAPHQRGSAAEVWRPAQRVNLEMLVQDLEALRLALGLRQWAVLGGSWGAALAVAYTSRHPQAVERVVLRGSFLGGSDDIWGLLRHLGATDLGRRLVAQAGLTPPQSRLGLGAWLAHTRRRLQRSSQRQQQRLAQVWSWAEGLCAVRGAWLTTLHQTTEHDAPSFPAIRNSYKNLRQSLRRSAAQLQVQRLQTAQQARSQRRRVLAQVKLLSQGTGRELRADLRRLRQQPTPPITAIHGRFDTICTPRNARRLQQSLRDQGTRFAVHWAHAGHLSVEPGLAAALTRSVAM